MVIHIKGQDLKIENSFIAEGAIKYATFEIRSDKSWRKFNKTVSFLHKTTNLRVDLPDIEEGKVYYFPRDILKSGEVEVAVFGVFCDTLITTNKKSFTVEKSIEDGKTPEITENAYLKFVNDVLLHRKSCEKSEKKIREMEKNCLDAKSTSLDSLEKSRLALDKSTKTLEKISGAVDAMGLALKGVKEREEELLSENSFLIRSEELRKVGEKERSLNEEIRQKSEYERQKTEEERKESELSRVNAEKLRALCEIQRAEKIADITSRLNAVEKNTDISNCYEEELCVENSLIFDNEQSVNEVCITPIFDEACLNLEINGEDRFKTTLKRVGEVADELRINSDGAYIFRRTSSITLDHDDEIIGEEEEGERKLFVIHLNAPFAYPDLSESIGRSTFFDYGKKESGDNIFVSGEFIFLYVTNENFNIKKKLSDLKKEGNPLTVTYPILEEERERVKTLYLPEKITKIKADGTEIKVKIKRNIFTTFKELSSRITFLEEKLKKGEQQ